MVAYEALWQQEKTSFKTLSDLFKKNPGSKPSDFIDDDRLKEMAATIRGLLQKSKLDYKTNLLVNGAYDYPDRLRNATEPIEILYYSGNLSYLDTRCIAIVGSRHPSEEGLARARKLVRRLVQDNFTIVSGLAMGIDTQAHTTAIEERGRTIAVIGTPLNSVYPKENADLQMFIAKEHLLVSQVPFYRYARQSHRGNRLFFPERNKTMSALSEATVIIEASDTSGTLIQAKAALQQGRKLFILESCFQNPNITWPARFLEQGAVRVREYEDIIAELPK